MIKNKVFLFFLVFSRVFSAAVGVFFIRLSGNDGLFLKFVSCPARPAVSSPDYDFIGRCVNAYFSFRRRLGIRDTCLVRSVIQCRVLRQFGLDARLSFGAMKAPDAIPGMNTAGHCWVSVEGDGSRPPYPLIFRYP